MNESRIPDAPRTVRISDEILGELAKQPAVVIAEFLAAIASIADAPPPPRRLVEQPVGPLGAGARPARRGGLGSVIRVDDGSLVDGLRLLMGPVRLVSGRHSGGRMSFGSRWRWTTANGWPGGCGSDCWHRTPEAAMDCFRAPPNAMAARR